MALEAYSSARATRRASQPPVCVAHAHDHMPADRVVAVSGRLILLRANVRAQPPRSCSSSLTTSPTVARCSGVRHSSTRTEASSLRYCCLKGAIWPWLGPLSIASAGDLGKQSLLSRRNAGKLHPASSSHDPSRPGRSRHAMATTKRRTANNEKVTVA